MPQDPPKRGDASNRHARSFYYSLFDLRSALLAVPCLGVDAACIRVVDRAHVVRVRRHLVGLGYSTPGFASTAVAIFATPMGIALAVTALLF
jgi:hypothetical protein